MRPEYRERWEEDIRSREKPFNKPQDLLRRAVSSEDFVDAAVIGGVAVVDILAGKVAEWQIPSDVLEAFHAQYPQYGSSFVQAVNNFSGHPEELTGLISGVKGKLFEIDYAEWLNHGHLPTGWTAELAQHANNPAWDIAISDSHGNVNEVLQLKASETLGYVREAIAAHPDIDVVVPHDIYERLAADPELLSHIVDGHETLDHLTNEVTSAADHAEAAGIHFHLPIVAIAWAAFQNRQRYRKGKVTLEKALDNVGERAALAVVARLAGYGAASLAHATWVGIPVSTVVRLVGGQVLHNRHRRDLLTMYIETVVSSTRKLEDQVRRPLLDSEIRLTAPLSSNQE